MSSPPSIPEVTGWQSVPIEDLKPKSRNNSLPKHILFTHRLSCRSSWTARRRDIFAISSSPYTASAPCNASNALSTLVVLHAFSGVFDTQIIYTPKDPLLGSPGDTHVARKHRKTARNCNFYDTFASTTVSLKHCNITPRRSPRGPFPSDCDKVICIYRKCILSTQSE